MSNIYLKYTLLFVFLILFQVLVLNNIQFSGYVNPYLYVLFILLLPFETPKWLLLILAFFLGFCVDIFTKTIGMNIAASVFMAFCRPAVIYLLSPKQDFEPGIRPCIRDLGFMWFFAYSLILILLHHLVLFYIEVFRFSEFFSTLYKVTISTAFTLVLVILSQYLFYNLKKT